MLSDLEAQARSREAFDEAWGRWSNRSSQEPIPRDSDWPVSVDNLLAAGLPLPVLLDCVERAMLTSSVPADRAFRYMCGMAWRRVREMNDAASELASEPPQSSPLDGQMSALADEVMEWTDEADRKRLRDEAFIESPCDREDSYERQLVVTAVRHLYGTKAGYQHRTRFLLEKLPKQIHARVISDARQTLLCADQADFSEDDLLSVALMMLAHEVERHCRSGTDWPEVDGVA
jgi:hypothetical protein